MVYLPGSALAQAVPVGAEQAEMGARSTPGLASSAATAAAARSAMPSGGRVVSGSAVVTVGGPKALVVNQNSRRAILDWEGFSIGSDAKVHFNNGSGATLNRVTGTSVSSIDGLLSASGSVYLINPNGVVVGQGGVVNVGGSFVGSTLDVDVGRFLEGGAIRLSGTSTAALVNYGRIGSLGGDISLVAARVENRGKLEAANGAVAMAAGYDVTLTDSAVAGGMLSVRVGGGDTMVRNLGDISAAMVEVRSNGGNIYALAGNTGGTIRATGVESQGGRIFLVADRGYLQASTALSASGAGSFVETSGATVDFTGATVQADNWLIDPNDIIIDAAAAATLSSNLASTNVELRTIKESVGGNGDIFVNSAVSWNSGRTLTLSAYRNITVNANLSATGGGSVILRADNEGTSIGTVSFGTGAQISTAGRVDIFYNPASYTTPNSYATRVTGGALLTSYMLVNTASQLQAINTNLTGTYTLGRDIDASSTASWNAGAGFAPIGTASRSFTGIFDGRNLTIRGLTIRGTTDGYYGLFGVSGGTIRNVQLSGVNIEGRDVVGGLVGSSDGTIDNAHVSGRVHNLGGWSVGGLASQNWRTAVINGSSFTGDVSGTQTNWIGGLLGWNSGATVRQSSSSGTVLGGVGAQSVGGLVGNNSSRSGIENSQSSSAVTGTSNLGGLVGFNDGLIAGSRASGAISRTIITGGNTAGGLVGFNASSGTIQGSFATGSVSGDLTGGLVGANQGIVSASYATGAATGTGSTGGLVGQNSGTVSSSYSSGAVKGNTAGGLIGANLGLAEDIYTIGTVLLQGSAGGGLVGQNSGTVRRAFATGRVQGAGSWFGGLVGLNAGTVENAYWDVGTTGFSAAVGASNTGASLTNVLGLGGTTGRSVYAPSSYAGFDLANSWFMIEGATRPFLRSEWSQTITNANQLQLISMDLNKSYTLAGNIDLGLVKQDGGMWNPANGFAPIWGGTSGGAIVPFAGSFNGSGYTISNAFVQRSSQYTGLFAASSGTIQNLTLTGTFRGTESVGSVVGYNIGTVSNVHVNADVTGSNSTGGIVGSNVGFIRTSSSIGRVTGAAGGIVGWNGGEVADSYSGAAVSGTTAGGIAGSNFNVGVIRRSYAIGAVGSGGGGLAGYNSGQIFDSGWDQLATGTTVQVANNVGSLTRVFALSGTGGLSPFASTSYGSGWDFSSVWYMIEGETRPFLRSEHTRFVSNVKQLQLVQLNPKGTFSLLGNIDASSTGQSSGMWRSAAGFVPIAAAGGFGGTLEGNGFGITNLKIVRAADNNVGLFSEIGSTGVVRGLTLSGTFGGAMNVGAVAGSNRGQLSQIVTSGSVTGNVHVGGAAGLNFGDILDSRSASAVEGSEVVGGLVGVNAGLVRAGQATGNVRALSNAGGLIGINHGTVDGGTASGGATGSFAIAGLVGTNFGAITSGVSSGTVGNGYHLGGLVGVNWGTILNSRSSSNVEGFETLGGLAGANAGTISDSQATGTVKGQSSTGGAAGINSGTLLRVIVSGGVTGAFATGGLAGTNFGDIIGSSASSRVDGATWTGGLVGSNQGRILSVFASGIVNGTVRVGGLVGYNKGSVRGAYATGAVTGTQFVGGLVGDNEAGIEQFYATGIVTGAESGALIGRNSGQLKFGYWTRQTAGQGAIGTNSGTQVQVEQIGGDTGRNPNAAATYTGFDFNTLWIIVEGTNPPTLRVVSSPTP